MSETPPVKRSRTGRKTSGAPTTPDAIEIAMNRLAKGEPPDGPAHAVLRGHRDLLRWQTISERMSVALKALTAVAGILVAGALIGLVWDASRYQGLVVQALAVPPDLAERGLTGDVMAGDLLDRLVAMQDQTDSVRAPSSYAIDWGDSTEVEIPQTGVSIGELQRSLRSWLGKETRISGVVYRMRDGQLSVTARTAGTAGVTFSGPEDELDSLMQKAAESVYARTQPYRFTVYLFGADRIDEALPIYQAADSYGEPESLWLRRGWGIDRIRGGDARGALALYRQVEARAPDMGPLFQTIADAEGFLGHDEAEYQARVKAGRLIARSREVDPLRRADYARGQQIRLTRRAALVSSVAGAAALPSNGWAQAANDSVSLADQVDAYVKRVMAGFPDQPAVSVAVVKDGQPVLTRGYGVRAIGGAAVDEHTLFAIASNTKAVTCAALAILIDEGKVKWDEPVRTYLPGFSLSKPELNDMVTVRDLVSHRIGFGLGAGDLLFWPNSDRTRAEIMAAVPHVPIEDAFRTSYHYCNLMFVVAGEVVAAASGMAWEDFVQTRILDRLGMTETLPVMTAADPAKSALPHGRVGPPLRYQGPMQTIGQSIQEVWDWASAGAAGGFVTTPVDWAKWIAVQLARGALPDGTRLYSEARANEMWRPNIIISSSAGPTETLPGRAIASTYATGWQVQDYRGERMITHGGGAPGYVSGTVLIPGRNAGFSYFTNAEESFLTRALRSGITDIVMGKAGFDWVADGQRLQREGDAASVAAAAEIDAKQAAGAPPSLPLAAYAGTWRDPWYGDITIQARDLQLWLSFSRTPALQGPVEPYDGDTLRTRFPDRREEDVFITFKLENGRPVSATMKAVSPDADFSYDYHDLRLTRV